MWFEIESRPHGGGSPHGPQRILPERRTLSRGPFLLGVLAVPAILLTAACRPVTNEVDTPIPLEEIASDASLPVEVNDRVTYWMRRFVGDQRPTFEQFLVRQGLYGDMIQAKLRARGMPEDLLYLAMIESGFRPQARSKVAAMGVWQFMGPTARQYGLRVDEYVDERRDPVRATDAALDYLETLHDRFGSWYLAAAAYNAGPNRVARVLRDHAEARTGDEELYWEIIEHLPWETRHYVPRLIAATLLAKRADDLGFAEERDQPYAYDRVWIPGNTRLSDVANELNVPASLLRDLNPHLIRGLTPPGGSHELRVPRGESQAVLAAINGGGSRVLADD